MPTKVKALSRKAALAKGALMTFLRPMIAQDQRIDLNPLLSGINNANFNEKKADLGTNLTKALEGKLAKDADIGQLTDLLDALGGVEETEGVDALETDPNSAIPLREGNDDGPAQAREFLSGKLSAEDMATYDSMFPAKQPGEDADESPEEKAAREKKEAADKAAKDAAENPLEEKVSKGAMDAAIRAATKQAAKDAETSTIARLSAVRVAEKEVQPYIGTLTIAQDSAEAVYKLALDHMGVDLKDVPPTAYRAVLKAVPVPGSKKEPFIAQDAAAVTGFEGRYPNASRITNLG